MSRWIDTFESHPFQVVWKKLLNISDELTIDDDTIVTDVEEVARFKKVVTFINEMISSCDPELVPESTWQNFHSQANACLQQIEPYQNNRNIAHITNANSNLDNLLTYIRPYQVIASEAAKSANTASIHIRKPLRPVYHHSMTKLKLFYLTFNHLKIKFLPMLMIQAKLMPK